MTLDELRGARFEKFLVARYSPENRCFAPDGDILYPPLPEFKPDGKPKKKKYHFLSAGTPDVLSQYGWVKLTENPFSLGEFVNEYLPGYQLEVELILLSQLFLVISRLSDGTPVAGDFFERGVERRTVELSFHKVFFHRSK